MDTFAAHYPRWNDLNHGEVGDPDISLRSPYPDAAPVVGLTQNLPPEMLGLIVNALTIQDIARLVQVDTSLAEALHSTTLSCWPHIVRIANATDPNTALACMEATTTLRWEWKAPLLRLFARRWDKLESALSTQWNAAWWKQVTETRQWSLTTLDADARAVVTRDLLIGEWYASHYSKNLSVLEDTERMLPRVCELPWMHWPAVLSEMLPRLGYWTMRAEIAAFIHSAAGTPFKIPTAFRCAIAQSLRENIDLSDISAILHTQFDCTVDVQRRMMDGPLSVTFGARPLAAFKHLHIACERWRPGDTGFADQVENVFALLNAHYFSRNAALDTPLEPKVYWRMARRLAALLAPNPENNCGAWPAWRATAAAFVDFSARLAAASQATELRTLLEEMMALPWQVQIELVHRVIEKPDDPFARQDDIDYLIGRVTGWSHETLRVCLEHGAPELASRAFAAAIMIRTTRYIPSQHAGYAGIFWMARNAFAKLPVMAWGSLLDALATPDQRRWHTNDKQSMRRNVRVFLSDPRASAIAPSPAFAGLIVRIAGNIWDTLPDRASAEKSRFDVFRERFDLPDDAMTALRTRVQAADNLAPAVAAHSRHA